jgi:hypothetical protein
VAAGVVPALEVVQVEADHADPAIVGGGLLERYVEPLLVRPPVRDPGQGVTSRLRVRERMAAL